MRRKLMAGATALALVASSLIAASPADAQWRGRHGGYHHGGGYHRGGGGGALLGGLAAGAILGGALAAQRPYYGRDYYEPGYVEGDADGYCLSRFKSYDPRSGTYLGYDGLRHPCP